jgi:hypothetical protein
LRKKIDEVKDLQKYLNVLPKSIQINSFGAVDISFIEHLFEAFDKSITSLNESPIKSQSDFRNSLTGQML